MKWKCDQKQCSSAGASHSWLETLIPSIPSLPPKQIKTQTKKIIIKSKKKMEREIQISLSPSPLLFTKQREHKIERIIIKHNKNNLNPPLFFLFFLSLQFSPVSLSLSLSEWLQDQVSFCSAIFCSRSNQDQSQSFRRSILFVLRSNRDSWPFIGYYWGNLDGGDLRLCTI